MSHPDLFLLDESVWMFTIPTGVPIYDFDFRAAFPCKTRQPPREPESRQEQIKFLQRPLEHITVVARIGPFGFYVESRPFFQFAYSLGLHLNFINSYDEHLRCSRISGWYPLIEDLTPRSNWYDDTPSLAEVETDFEKWPIFMKGIRQTSRHQRALSIINGPDDFNDAVRASRQDWILRWQSVVCREFVPLRPVEDPFPDRIPSSFEFRTFWWKGQLVGYGRYW